MSTRPFARGAGPRRGGLLTLATRSIEPLRRAELPVDTIELARYLVGKTLVHDLATGRLSGRIVEVEGYFPGDAAGHAFRGKTRSNQTLFLGRGYCYVYFTYGSTYGSSFMVNVTSEELVSAGACFCARWNLSRVLR